MKKENLFSWGNVTVERAGNVINVVVDNEILPNGNPDRAIFLQMAINNLNTNTL